MSLNGDLQDGSIWLPGVSSIIGYKKYRNNFFGSIDAGFGHRSGTDQWASVSFRFVTLDVGVGYIIHEGKKLYITGAGTISTQGALGDRSIELTGGKKTEETKTPLFLGLQGEIGFKLKDGYRLGFNLGVKKSGTSFDGLSSGSSESWNKTIISTLGLRLSMEI